MAAPFLKSTAEQRLSVSPLCKISCSFLTNEAAPEQHINPKAHAYQTIDTWALGAVFSLVLTWTLLDQEGINMYAIYRGKAIEDLNKPVDSDSQMPGDCFHDGSGKTLPNVREWHKLLREMSPDASIVTLEVLDLVQNRMFVEDPAERASSYEVRTRLEEIVSAAEARWTNEVPRPFSITSRIMSEISEECPAYPSFVKTDSTTITRLLKPAISGSELPSTEVPSDRANNADPPSEPTLQLRNTKKNSTLPSDQTKVVNGDAIVNTDANRESASSPGAAELRESIAVTKDEPTNHAPKIEQSTAAEDEIIETCKRALDRDRFQQLRRKDPDLTKRAHEGSRNLLEILFSRGRKKGDGDLLAIAMLLEEDGLEVREESLNPKGYEYYKDYKKMRKEDQKREGSTIQTPKPGTKSQHVSSRGGFFSKFRRK